MNLIFADNFKPYTATSLAPWCVGPITASSQPTTNRHCCGIDEAVLPDLRRQGASMDSYYGLRGYNMWVPIMSHFQYLEFDKLLTLIECNS